ncbi:PEGA domain-containing protein [uncultured Methanoregula sp.]|uniref:PEGA domain-containing protein n=1 Tax=uncultured Methanoregula sp. TaxID=1005933 RepID=UPI002AAB0972|nr:PEGA domain-containing protein [uncultured Methanoregula sp.]
MGRTYAIGKAGIILLGLLFCGGLVTGAAAAGGIQTAMGDTVTLSGYSYGSPNAYLFLTGPNLPANGVALDNINRQADRGGFTIVSVDGNNHWTYKWNTANIGGRLDAGSYMIWVVNGPNDRSRLNEAEYSTIQVTMGVPSISVDTPTIPASLEVNTEPYGASVVLNGKFLGITPLMKSDLTPGTFTLSLTKRGYENITTPVRLEAGMVTTVDAPLAPQAVAPVANLSPSGTLQTAPVTTEETLPATPPATTPKRAAGLVLVPVSALGIAVILGMQWRKR